MGKGGKKPRKEKPIKRKGIDRIYHDNYKQLLLIPLALLLIALAIIGYQFATTGTIVDTGVSLSGGLTITIPTSDDPVTVDEVEATLSQLENDYLVRELEELGAQQAISVQVAPLSANEDLEVLETRVLELLSTTMTTDNYTVEIVGPSLGKAFLIQTIWALAVAFVFMALVVFWIFKTFIPSFAVVLAALSDIIITLAAIIVLDVQLSTAGIAGFLMLIGYSVDTDILLSTRVLKRVGGTVYERTLNGMKTGLIMNLTTLVAVTLALIVTQSEIIQQIMLILLIGLIVDVINTWIQNAGILRWYMEGRE